MIKIGIIYGSSRPSTVGASVAKWFVEQAQVPAGVELEMVDLKAVNLPLLAEAMPPMMGQYSEQSTKDWAERIKGFDGFIFVVAEYNNGYTPILKNAIDTLFAEWNDKPAAMISYGAYPISTAKEQLAVVLKHVKLEVLEPTFHISPSHEAIQDGSVDADKVAGDSPSDILEAISKALTHAKVDSPL